ncbi:MAG: GHKL domain-containing protein [Akkermansia sp.]|nr:GHKL domain-containing protein [Akkermansia sp.]
MIPLSDNINRALERLKEVYFSDAGRTVELAAGELLVGQGERTRRMYRIMEGSIISYREEDNQPSEHMPTESEGRRHELFRADAGSFVCVQSFFSRAFRSNTSLYALENTRLAYIDDTTPIVEQYEYGPFAQQFLPVVIHELAARNDRIFGRAAEREEAMRLLQRSEMAALLGQLSAGIAHELNNAVGVISRRTEFMAETLTSILEAQDKLNAQLFLKGYEDTTFRSASDLRPAVRHYERDLGMSQEAAKVLAHIAPTDAEYRQLSWRFVRNIKRNYRIWELGHDLRDMRMASNHATGIVRAVKQMGAPSSAREAGVDVVQTVKDALHLLHNKLKHITLKTEFHPLPAITADKSELMQIWTNIVQNAYDALTIDKCENPCIKVTTSIFHAEGVSLLPKEYVTVSITNNGPKIPQEHIEKIYQPSFTTKKQGLDFGLGLGLSIVRRIVDSYNGTIGLNSSDEETTFTINLPTTEIHGND